MAQIFVSYAREDFELAKQVVDALANHGHSVWWDKRLTPSRGFDQLIEEEIQKADHVVVLWTQASVKSEWVRNEANYAIDKLVPARFEEVSLPIAFHRLQTADLTGWKGEATSEEWVRFLSWIDSAAGAEKISRSKGSTFVGPDEPNPTNWALVAVFGVGSLVAVGAFAMIASGGRPDGCELDFPDARELDAQFDPAIPLTSDCIDRDFATFKDCENCPPIVVLPAGEFERGTSSADGGRVNELPVRTVTIKYRFGIGRMEVSWGQWQACVVDGACTAPGNARDDRSPYLPVHALSWVQTSEYLDWISAKTGETYRLPSEAEWEYAAKAGASSQYPHGDGINDICGSANVLDRSVRDALRLRQDVVTASCRDGIVYRSPVGSYVPNAFGLFDMVGNVVEPVQDCFYWSYERATDFGAAYERDGCPERVIRGGSYDSNVAKLRVGYRDSTLPDKFEPRLGLRVVREIR